MNIYIPYTYLLYHVPTQKFYYGARYANRKYNIAHPKDFWNTYFTSSKPVKSLIEQYGKDSFIFQIRKCFTNADQCQKWETTVLKRMKVKFKDKWLNKTDNIAPRMEHENHPLYGKTHKPEAKLKIGKSSSLRNSGKNNPMFGKRRIGYKHTNNTLLKMSKNHKIRLTDNSIIEITNLVNFCKNNKLDRSNLYKTKQTNKFHKGFQLIL